MRQSKLAKFVLGVVLGASVFAPQRASGADVPIFPSGPVFPLNNLIWGQSGPQGFNNNFFFTPFYASGSVCVYVYNNNPVNNHPFNATITISGNSSNTTPSDQSWSPVAIATGIIAPLTVVNVSGGVATLGANVGSVPKVSLNFSASSTLGGNPDTANVIVSQTPGNCLGGSTFNGNTPQSVTASTPMQTFTESLSQSFVTQSGNITNPASGAEIAQVNANNGFHNIFLDHVTIIVSAAASITINSTTSLGTSCTALAPVNQKLASSALSTSTCNGSCTGVPTVGNALLTAVPIPVGVPTIIDLRGFEIPANGTNGIDVVMAAALTGTINVSYSWYEK